MLCHLFEELLSAHVFSGVLELHFVQHEFAIAHNPAFLLRARACECADCIADGDFCRQFFDRNSLRQALAVC
jgi:hypothetical protein